METIIDGKRYSTNTATLVAHNRYWDGSNYDRHGRNLYLYKTPKGRFFLYETTMWQGECDEIRPIDRDSAKFFYEHLRIHEMSYEEAFGEEPEEA